jgi:hypothetical protein
MAQTSRALLACCVTWWRWGAVAHFRPFVAREWQTVADSHGRCDRSGVGTLYPFNAMANLRATARGASRVANAPISFLKPEIAIARFP